MRKSDLLWIVPQGIGMTLLIPWMMATVAGERLFAAAFIALVFLCLYVSLLIFGALARKPPK